MSKELEALNYLYEEATKVLVGCNDAKLFRDIIESALERKEKLEIKNAELKARNEKLEKAVKIFGKTFDIKTCAEIIINSNKTNEEDRNLLKEMSL